MRIESISTATEANFARCPREGPDYRVKDLGLWRFGREELRLAEEEVPGLMAPQQKHEGSRPSEGARIKGHLHMTVQSAVLIETMTDLGRRWRCQSTRMPSLRGSDAYPTSTRKMHPKGGA